MINGLAPGTKGNAPRGEQGACARDNEGACRGGRHTRRAGVVRRKGVVRTPVLGSPVRGAGERSETEGFFRGFLRVGKPHHRFAVPLP